MLGSINSIESFSTLDGPGIRTVVFLNGCNKRCLYCHNPEMWHKLENNISSFALYQKLIRNKNYFGKLGGITFSGGEPLLQSQFLIEVCKLLKKDHINIALDTAGFIDEYTISLLKYIDIVIFDIKDIDVDNYFKLTKSSLRDSLNFIKILNDLDKKIIIRQVIVPNMHDNITYIKNLKKYINNNFKVENIIDIEFIPYHHLGKEKYLSLGIDYPLNIPEMDKEKCENLYQIYKNI